MKKFLMILLAAVFLLSFTACSKGVSGEAVQLSIGILPDVDSIPLIIARQQGLFEKEGVNVKLLSFKSAPDRDSALQTGRIDGAISDMLAAVFAKDGSFDVKITSRTDGCYKLLAGKSLTSNHISGIKGKGIAISKNTIIEYTTDMLLKESGVSSSEIKKEIIPQIPARLEMLQAGQVDAATLPEPMASVAVKNGARILDSTDKLGINPGVLIFTSKSIKDKSKEIKAFYKAYNQAVEYLKKEPVSNYIDTLIKEAGFPDGVKDTLSLPSYNKAAKPTEKDFDNVVKWLKDKGLIKNAYSSSELVDDRFVR